jgi:Tfp pilus assembly protein PilF
VNVQLADGYTMFVEPVGDGGLPLIELHGGPGLDHTHLRPWLDPLGDAFRVSKPTLVLAGEHDRCTTPRAARVLHDGIRGSELRVLPGAGHMSIVEAQKEYLDAVREQPNSAKAHQYYGQYLASAEKNYAAAFQELETAIKIDPNYMPGWYWIGRTAGTSLTNLARGEEALKKYLAYTPKEDEPPLANTHYWLGTIQEKLGRKAEAKQHYQAALKLNPNLKQASEALKRVS